MKNGFRYGKSVCLLALILVLGACGTTRYSARPFAKDIGFLSVSDDLSPGQSMGIIDETACTGNVLTFIPLGRSPTYDDIKLKLIRDRGVRYLIHVSTAQVTKKFLLWGSDCLELRGEAFK